MLPALVLTAGLGTRLDPLTRLVAKGAVPVNGRPLVEHVLAWLQREGVRDAVLNLHHKPETITAAVGDGTHLGLSVRYSWEHPLLGSAGGPRHALPLLTSGASGGSRDTDTFLIVNGDTLTTLGLASLIAAHETSGADVTLAVVPNIAPDHYNGILADGAGAVTAFMPKGRAGASWHFVGVQVVRAQVFAGLADGVASETIAGVYRALVATEPGRVRIWQADATFLDVGTPADYLATALSMGSSAGHPIVEGGVHVARSARLTRVVVWPGARVGEDVVLDGCIVAGAVVLPRGLHASRSVIVPDAVATPDDCCERRDGLALFSL